MFFYRFYILLVISFCVQSDEIQPESETFGQCSRQLEPEINKRNCRYGKCENIKNGTDFVCHCDLHITGRRCDQPAKYLKADSQSFFHAYNPCSSNPCWSGGICVLLNSNIAYKCKCPHFKTGTFCHLELNPLSVMFYLKKTTTLSTTTTITTTISTIQKITKKVLELNKTNIPVPTKIIKMFNVSTVIPSRYSYMPETIENLSTKQVLFSKAECNVENCRLGKCLENGTCKCSYPVFGKNCDKIDECLVIKCHNGFCMPGKGCICERGFGGYNCELNYLLATPKSAIYSSSFSYLNQEKQKQNTSTTSSTKTNRTNSQIENCENGGILIENICICLNQFHGLRCEKAPSQDSIKNFNTNNFIMSRIISKTKFKLHPDDNYNKNDDFSFNFENLKDLNASFLTSVVWPWTECFPGSSLVDVYDSKTNLIISKPVSKLEINDLVRVNEDNTDKYSRVIHFLHRVENLTANFIRLYFQLAINSYNSTENFITLTPKHLVWLVNKKTYFPADKLGVGDLLLYSNQNKLQNVNIYKIERIVLNEGIYAPLVESGHFLVNGIKCSCYSVIKSHYMAQLFFNILHFINEYLKVNFEKYSLFILNFINLLKLDHFFFDI